MLVALAIAAVYMAGYYSFKARFDTEAYDIANAKKDGKIAEILGVLTIALLLAADVIDLSLAPIT
jgi:hypothetical protein